MTSEAPSPTLLDRLIPAAETPSTSRSSAYERRVLRDLSWLLGTANLESSVDLSAYPALRDSVLNYGLSALEGLNLSVVNPAQVAAATAVAIQRFEPRLRRVRVVPVEREDGDVGSVEFRITAELHGSGAPERVVLSSTLESDGRGLEVRNLEP